MFLKKTKKSKKKSLKYKFSRLSQTKKIAIIFVFIFGLIGSAYLFKSFALDAGVEADFTVRLNQVRTSRGISALATNNCLTNIARAHAEQMAREGNLYHIDTGAYNNCYGSENVYRLAGENIGRGPSVDAIHNALVNSPLHYENMVNTGFRSIGMGVAYDGSGQMFVAQGFSNVLCGSAKSLPGCEVPGSNYRSLVVANGATSTQGYKVNGRGETRTLDGKYVLSSGDTWNFDAIRSVAVNSNWKGYKMDLYGGLHPFSAAGPSGAPAPATGGPYWSGQDIARDVKLIGSLTKGYVLDGYGALHSFNGAATPYTSAYWPGWDIANSFAINDAGTQGYVLDGFGGLHPFNTGTSAKPKDISNGDYFSGNDIARKIVLSPDGRQGYVLDGFGGVHPFSQPGTCKPLGVSPNNNGYTPGADVFVDISIRSWGSATCTTKSQGYTMDVGGGMHAF